MKEVPTRFLSNGRRVYKSMNGKLFSYNASGDKSYRPKVSHITKGSSKFVVKSHHKVPYGMKPKAKYSKGGMASGYSILSKIFARRRSY